MNKKEYVLELLKKLEPHRDIITGVIAMVELWNCTDEDIDQIIKLIENHIGEIKDQDLKNRLVKAQNILMTIRKQEEVEKIKEEKEADALLEQIENL